MRGAHEGCTGEAPTYHTKLRGFPEPLPGRSHDGAPWGALMHTTGSMGRTNVTDVGPWETWVHPQCDGRGPFILKLGDDATMRNLHQSKMPSRSCIDG